MHVNDAIRGRYHFLHLQKRSESNNAIYAQVQKSPVKAASSPVAAAAAPVPQQPVKPSDDLNDLLSKAANINI